MRFPILPLVAFISALGVGASQLPLEVTRPDPSFPQPGTFDSSKLRMTPSPDIPSANLVDLLTIQKSASLFFDYARDIPSVSTRLSSILGVGKGNTLLVPNDKAIMAMARKPHQVEGEYTEKKVGESIERFLSAHIVAGDMQLDSADPQATLLEGFKVNAVKDDSAADGLKIVPGDVAVTGITEASNGKILWLDGALPYQQ
ncbi:hypothetical protein P7C73_g298, partial [Tremellales sp. Uapishka_1]